MEFVQPTTRKKSRSLISIFLTATYLLLFFAAVSLPFIYQSLPIISTVGLERIFVAVPAGILALYFLIFSFSFFRRGDNWLIFCVVLIFFSTVFALILAVLGFLGGKNLWHSGIPACASNIINCNAEDGITLLSALLLGISIPTLLLNILTFIGIFKTMGSND